MWVSQFVGVSICTGALGQTEIDTDLKFGTHTHFSKPYPKPIFCLFEKVTQGAASLEKLTCHVDFLHISSIALFFSISLYGQTRSFTPSSKIFFLNLRPFGSGFAPFSDQLVM